MAQNFRANKLLSLTRKAMSKDMVRLLKRERVRTTTAAAEAAKLVEVKALRL